ncbi:MAG: hypothetical protein RI894_2063, partial [Bacteroidota bacterium]
MHDFLVHFHSGTRWLLLGAAMFAIFRYATGNIQGRPFEKLDNTAGAIFVGTVHFQLLLGFILYLGYFQPWNADMSVVMKDPVGRFFAVEHIAGMLLG